MIERSSTTGKLQYKIVAPFLNEVPSALPRSIVDAKAHAKFIFDIQLLRGNVYREAGPIASQLLPDGRHYQGVDNESWHVVVQDENGRVLGCSRYRPVKGGFEELGASTSALAYSQKYGALLRSAIERQIVYARNHNVQFGEAGGWALRPEVRCSTAAVNVALMTFVLVEHLGGGLGIATATTLHHSASILRRLGGRRLADLPAYYEPKYGSVIEVLHFSSANIHPQFAQRFERLKQQIGDVEVICRAKGEKSDRFETEIYGPSVTRGDELRPFLGHIA